MLIALYGFMAFIILALVIYIECLGYRLAQERKGAEVNYNRWLEAHRHMDTLRQRLAIAERNDSPRDPSTGRFISKRGK